MPWFFVDDAFADSKPVMALDRSLRNEAIGLWVRCGAWSAKEETDGHVPLDVVKGFGGTPRIIKALQFQAELWWKPDQNLVETTVETTAKSSRKSREIVFANWEKWQKTKAENEARRKREAEKKSTWRAGKKGRGYVPSTEDMSTGDMVVDTDLLSTGDTPGESLYPDPTRPDPSLLVTSSGGVTSVDASENPRPHCPRHSENHDGPCRKCKARREWDESHEAQIAHDDLERRRAARAAVEAAIKLCNQCDEEGWRYDDRAIKCTHQEARHA